MNQLMCTNCQESAHSGEGSALCIWAHGQSVVSIGHDAFTVIWSQLKSGHSYFLPFAEQCRAVVKEVSLFLYRMYRLYLPSTNHVNAELYRALCIVKQFGRRMVKGYRARFGLCMPLEIPQLLHTLHMEPPTTFF